jgi:hypothetical protein
MDGGLPPLDGRDGLAVVTDNATANKIDTFLLRTVRYDAHVHDGVVEATLTVSLHNTAPATGYPDYVLGSEFLDLPNGTNRTLLTVYSPLAYTAVTLDEVPGGMTTDSELGWNAYTMRLDLAPGQTRTIVLTLSGLLTTDHYAFVLRPQPMAHDDAVSISVDGDVQIQWGGRPTRRSVIDEAATPHTAAAHAAGGNEVAMPPVRAIVRAAATHVAATAHGNHQRRGVR